MGSHAVNVMLIEHKTLALIAICILVIAFRHGLLSIRQRRCKHEHGAYENHVGHAICKECGKDLGYIGDWEKKQREAGNG